MKTIQTTLLVTLATLLLLPGFGAFVSATSGSHINAPTLPATVFLIDNVGNVYKLTISGSTATYTISGQLMNSPYLGYTPWAITGAGHGATFAWTNTDPNTSDSKYCSFAYQGTFSASGKSASGTWKNAGCGFETGTFTLAMCTSKVCIPPSPHTTSRPGV